MNGFKLFDMAQLIVALIFRLGVIWSKKMDVKFNRVFIRYKDTHLTLNSLVFYELLMSF